MPYEIVRFPSSGTIDADGHILEPVWLWEEYLEVGYRERALRVRCACAVGLYGDLIGRC
mgnify:CR=1 FL=1